MSRLQDSIDAAKRASPKVLSRLEAYGVAFKRISPFIAGAAVLVALGGLYVVATGSIDTRAAAGHGQFEADLLHGTLRRSVANGAKGIAPPDDIHSRDRKVLGAGTYAQYCASCHGAPGVGQNPIALAMTPRPRYLVETAPEWTDAELFYLLQHGVKYAGMPAWPVDDRPDEVWSMVSFVRALPEMTHGEYRRMALGAAVGPPPPSAPQIIGESDPETREAGGVVGRDISAHHAYATPATAFGAVEGTVVRQCAGCHGYGGVGGTSGLVPNLSIQNPDYLRKSLRAYADGSRRSGIMRPIAASLTEQQIEHLADWYAQRPAAPAPPPGEASDELIALGETLANQGDGEVAACESCHGVAERLENVYPALAGQSAAYHLAQLEVFAKGVRGDVVDVNPMYGIAHDLSDKQMRAVAAYYALQRPETYELRQEYGEAREEAAMEAGGGPGGSPLPEDVGEVAQPPSETLAEGGTPGPEVFNDGSGG